MPSAFSPNLENSTFLDLTSAYALQERTELTWEKWDDLVRAARMERPFERAFTLSILKPEVAPVTPAPSITHSKERLYHR
ncbi:MAG: hypothetical protein ACE5PM_08645 [Candidatus Hydrothermarchaeales archaeon]